MKKENLILFSKMLILYYVIGAIAFVIVFFTIGKMPWPDVICDAFAGIGFAAVIICLCKSEEKETTDENMLKMFKHYNLKVYEKDGYMIGRFRGIRRLFFKDIEYRRGSNRITGPKNIISKYSRNPNYS